MYHFIIQNPKNIQDRREFKNVLDNSIFHPVEYVSTSVTILAAIEGKAYNNKLIGGLKIGDLEVGISTSIGRPHFCINNESNGEAPLNEPLIIRIYAKANGEVTITNENNKISSDRIIGNIFNGLKIGEFGVYLDLGVSISLLNFEVYDGKYGGQLSSKIEKQRELEGGERYVKIKTKDQNLDRLRLKLIGLSDEETDECLQNTQDLSGALDYALNRFGYDSMKNSPLSLDQETITDVKIFDSKDQIPSDYKLVKIFEDARAIDIELPNRKLLAVKKENFLTGNCLVEFSIGENPSDLTEVGDLSINDERKNPVFMKISAPSKLVTAIKDIIFIKVMSIYSVILPYGYKLITDKEGAAINLASKTEKKFYILVGYKNSDSILNCPFYSLKDIQVKGGNTYGLVDQVATNEPQVSPKEEQKTYEEYSVMELYNFLVDIEEKRKLATSKKLLVQTLKKYPNMLINMPGSASLGKLLTYIDTELATLETPVRKLLKSLEQENFRTKAAKECMNILISCLITKSGSSANLKSITVESAHPYDNSLDKDDSITIPGAKSLKIKFDPQCATESGCDYLKFYEQTGRAGEIKTCSGTGEGNWPEFEIPGDTFYTFFHSDGSVNAWGYKFEVIPITGGPSKDQNELKPDAALWMLEKFVENVDTSEELQMLYTPRFIQPLFLFILASPTIEEKTRALNILKSFIKYPNPTYDNIIKILFSEANELYNANKNAKTSHPLLQSIVSLLFKAITISYSGSQDQWFMELNELVSDMKGLTDKDEALDVFIFDNFKSKIMSSMEQHRESTHPYKRKTQVDKITIEGAAFIDIEFDSNSKIEDRDAFFFSYDPKAKNSVENNASGAGNEVSVSTA